jgi:hypothetical protein
VIDVACDARRKPVAAQTDEGMIATLMATMCSASPFSQHLGDMTGVEMALRRILSRIRPLGGPLYYVLKAPLTPSKSVN